MRWQKGISDKHVYDWQFFSLQDGSLGRLLVTGFLVGLVYAVCIVKVWPRLPGSYERDSATMCRDLPNFDLDGLCTKLRRAGMLPTMQGGATTQQVKPKPSPVKPSTDTCASDYAQWEAMPDTNSGEHNEKWTRRAELVKKHGTRNFKAGCSDQ